MLNRQEAGRSALLSAVMPSKGDGAGTDTFRPHRAYGQLRNTENRQRLRGLAAASLMPPLRLIAVPPCSFSLLPDKDFTITPPLAACFSSPRVETMIIRLPALSAYHRLALPGLVISIFFSALLFFQINHITQCYPFLNNWNRVIICEEIWNTVRI